MLGKRKRDKTVIRRKETEQDSDSGTDHQQLFRHYFETRFNPLPEPESHTSSLLEEDASEEVDSQESEWEGFSEYNDDSPPIVEVVEHSKPTVTDLDFTRRTQLKAFMVNLFGEQKVNV